MAEPLPGETSDGIDHPYRAPAAPLVPVPRKSPVRPFRSALIGAGIGGSLGVALDSMLWHALMMYGGDDEVGPMFVAKLPLIAAGIVVAGAAVGAMGGLLVGLMTIDIACMSARPSRSGPVGKGLG